MTTIVPFRHPPNARLQFSLNQLGKTLQGMQQRIDRLERSQRMAQLDFASIHNGAIQSYDSGGTLRSIFGLQDDGSYAHQHYNAPAPLAPSVPSVLTGVTSLNVTWNGQMSDGSYPLADFAYIQVHASTTPNFTPSSSTQQGIINQAGTFIAAGLNAGATYYVTLVAINTSGIASPPSTYASGTPVSVVGAIPPGSIQATQLGFTARTIGGVSISVQNTAPSNPQPGDLWYDGSNNYRLNVWNGISWVPYQFGTNAIAAGSVTAALVAAGTVIAGIVDGTTITGAQLIAKGTNGGFFGYNAAGTVLESSNCAAPTTDPILGISCPAGFATYNSAGRVINLMSTANNAFFQYYDHPPGQGSMILSVASASGTDPVGGQSYGAGFGGINPVFGDFMSCQGSVVNLGLANSSHLGSIGAHASGNGTSQNPYLKVDANEQGTGTHMQMLLQGTSPDGTSLGQMVLGLVTTNATLSPITNAMAEIQGVSSVPDPALQVVSVAAGDNAFGIRASGDAANRLKIDSNGRISLNGSGTSSAAMFKEQTDATSFTITGTGTPVQASKSWSIPANNAVAGTWYRLTVLAFGTQGTTAQNLTLGIGLNGSVPRSNGFLTNTMAASSAFRAKFVIDFHVVSSGAAGTMDMCGFGVADAQTGNVTVSACAGSSAAGGEAFNTTVANTIDLRLSWVANTGAPTITTYASTLERIGP